jgi:2,3-dihydroxybenzoate-AMP ligase
MWQVRQARVIWLYREAPPDGALLLNLPLSIAGTYIATMWALNVGYTLVVARQAAMAQIPALITQHGITRVSLLPVQLAQILDALPADWRRPPSLEILLFGAALPETLRRAALDRMASLVTEIYGSNEFSVATLTRAVDSDGFGIICPDVEVEIIDENGALVPDGATGEIRLRSPSSFAGYLDDPGLTRRMLRDGWFYPGDVGLRRGWQLKVIGRVDDHVNLGGVKYPLAAIEDIARRSAGDGVKDLAAVAIANDAGILEIHVALVTDGKDDRAVLERMVAVLRPNLPGGLHFIRLAEIPRNPAGKIDRTRLAAVIAAARAR